MADATGRDVPVQVRQVRNVLLRDYAPLLDVSDLQDRPESEREQRLLSRSLTALAVRIVTRCDAASAAAFVIDGIDDQGIDAIALVPSPPRVYLMQTKWSNTGSAGLSTEAAVKLVDGLSRIDDELSNQFNYRGEALAEQAKDLMANRSAPVTLVIALMGTAPLSDGPAQVLANAERKYNLHGARLDTRTLSFGGFPPPDP